MEKLHIQTKRLAIRNLVETDLEDFFFYRSNPDVTKYQGFGVMTIKECVAFIDQQKHMLFGKPGEWVQYAIEDLSTTCLVGDCAIKLQETNTRIAEVGITISHKHQQNGFAKEALMGILDFLFDRKNVYRIQEIVDAENTEAIRLLESVGFRQEGHFIENIFFKGKWGSEFQYAMLAREWKLMRSKISVDTYNKSAKGYQDRFMEMDLYHDAYDMFCKLIKTQGPEVLEIATGPGNITSYILTKRPDFKITGIDLAPNMIELAKKNVRNAEFLVMDCRDISQLEGSYDAIMCGFCMPYLSKEECAKLIEDASALLKTDGVIYFSTMEDAYEKSGYETTSFGGENEVFIYYHQEQFLKEQLLQNGFQIIDFQRKLCPEPDGSFLTDMIFIAKKVR